MMRALFLYVALAVVLSTVGKALAQGDELPPTRYVWSASGQTGSFIHDVNAPFNPISELTWDQANTTHSGEAIQYNVTRDNITGTQIVFTGGQIGQGFFSIQMQHPDSGLPSIPSGFDFLPPDDLGIGWIGGQFITSTSSSPIDSIFNDGFAILPPNDAPVFTATRINGIDGDLVINESGAATNLTLDAQATDVQAGFLYFTIDGVGPTAAANTGAGSLRSSQSVNRSVGGADSNGLPEASYEFTVIDPRGAEAVVTRNVFVQNVAPTVTSYTLDGVAGGLVFDEGAAFSVDAVMQATDPGADAITFAIDGQSAGSGGSTPNSTRSSTGVTIDFDGQSGVYPVSFAATDDDETTTVTRNVTVNNLPPAIVSYTLNGLAEDLVLQEGDPIVVLASMTASDPGPDALEFRIDNQDAGVGGATPQSIRESLELVVLLDGQDGAYPISFEALDDETAAFATRTVTVENVAPTVTSLNLSKTTINEGERITATVQATDPGPDALAMTVNGRDAGVGGAGPSAIRTSDTVTIGPFPQRSFGSDEVEILATAIDDGQVPGELIETTCHRRSSTLQPTASSLRASRSAISRSPPTRGWTRSPSAGTPTTMASTMTRRAAALASIPG